MIRMKCNGSWLQLEDGVWTGEDSDLVALAGSISRLSIDGRYTIDRDMQYAVEVANVLRPEEVDMSQHIPTRSAAGVVY